MMLLAMTGAAALSAPLSLAARDSDAASSRGVLTSHAESLGEGTATITSHDLAVVSGGYGFSEDIQASVAVLLPLRASLPLAVAGQGKAVVLRREHSTAALRADVGAVRPGSTRISGRFGGGVLVDLFPLDTDRLGIHGGLSLHRSVGRAAEPWLPAGLVFLGELGTAVRLHPHAALLAEILVPSVFARDELSYAPNALLPYVVRVHSSVVAVEAGFAKRLGEGLGKDPVVLGLPWVSVGLRRR